MRRPAGRSERRVTHSWGPKGSPGTSSRRRTAGRRTTASRATGDDRVPSDAALPPGAVARGQRASRSARSRSRRDRGGPGAARRKPAPARLRPGDRRELPHRRRARGGARARVLHRAASELRSPATVGRPPVVGGAGLQPLRRPGRRPRLADRAVHAWWPDAPGTVSRGPLRALARPARSRPS